MKSKANFAIVISCTSILITLGTLFWVHQNNNQNITLTLNTFEDMLEEVAKANPKIFVNLLNASATSEQSNQQEELEEFIFKHKGKVLSCGFTIKKNKNPSPKSLVIFMDMTCPHCITFLKKINTALNDLDSTVVIIPISVLGELSTQEANLIMAASLQNTAKAIALALTYDTINTENNNRMADATAIGLNTEKLSQNINSKAVIESVKTQTKLSEQAGIPGIPSIFLITEEKAYFLPPSEIKDLENMVTNPEQFTSSNTAQIITHKNDGTNETNIRIDQKNN